MQVYMRAGLDTSFPSSSRPLGPVLYRHLVATFVSNKLLMSWKSLYKAGAAWIVLRGYDILAPQI